LDRGQPDTGGFLFREGGKIRIGNLFAIEIEDPPTGMIVEAVNMEVTRQGEWDADLGGTDAKVTSHPPVDVDLDPSRGFILDACSMMSISCLASLVPAFALPPAEFFISQKADHHPPASGKRILAS